MEINNELIRTQASQITFIDLHKNIFAKFRITSNFWKFLDKFKITNRLRVSVISIKKNILFTRL